MTERAQMAWIPTLQEDESVINVKSCLKLTFKKLTFQLKIN